MEYVLKFIILLNISVQKDGETPTIKYVRKVRTAKKESIFVYPRNDDICVLKHVEDILAVLPAPEISRRGHVIFKINFSNNYNIQ